MDVLLILVQFSPSPKYSSSVQCHRLSVYLRGTSVAGVVGPRQIIILVVNELSLAVSFEGRLHWGTGVQRNTAVS